MPDAYIFDAVRTPRAKGRPARDGRPGGSLCEVGPHELISQLINALSKRHGDEAMGSVARMILGCVGQVGSQGGHIALVSRLASCLDNSVSVKTINNYCVSGLTAVNEGAIWARAGEHGLTIAGGVEMLSQVPFLADRASYYSDPDLSKALDYVAPIMGAELMATLEGFSKNDLDQLTLRSHLRAAEAWKDGRYEDGVVPVRNQQGQVMVAQDELVRPDLTLAKLAEMPPAFEQMGAAGQDAIMLKHNPVLDSVSHIHSIANTPGMADGAALVLLGSLEDGEKAGLKPKARIRAIAETSGDPVLQFGAGFDAMESALRSAGVSLSDIELIEFMEAFAAPPLKFERDYDPDMAKVNVNGGHIAMGHPMGATGAILTTTLLHELTRRNAGLGLVVALAGGGIGAAMVIEQV